MRRILFVAGLVALAGVQGPTVLRAQEAEAAGGEQVASIGRKALEEFVCEYPPVEELGEDTDFDESELPIELTGGRVLPGEGDDDDSADDDEEFMEEVDEAEIQAWRDAAQRFSARAGEFADEVNRIIRRNYEDEVKELRDGYDRLLGDAELEERRLRKLAIEAHEKFVKAHASSPYTARRMFRLAELYFEQSEEDFLNEFEEYQDLADQFDAGKVEFLPEPPQKDYRRSIALYKRIIRDFPQYTDLGAVYYMMGYCYSDDASRHLDPERAEQTYRAMLDNVPVSVYRAQAYFRLGDLYFEENQTRRALAYYNEILNEFDRKEADSALEPEDERLYELALYKVAWAYYKIDDLPVAIEKFVELIDWAERKEARTGKATDLKGESIRYLAVSFADQAGEMDVSPIEYAGRLLTRLGERPWSYGVLKELAGILKDQARFEEAVKAYLFLQERYPLSPDGPEFQNNVIVLYNNLAVPDRDAAAAARVTLTNQYGFDSPWHAANKNNKDAIAKATQYILESLQWVALTYHAKAQETAEPMDYVLAARKYEEYLERYPFAKNAYELSYNLADCYFWIGGQVFTDNSGVTAVGWERAIDQYSRLFGFPETEFRQDAILGIMFSLNYLWKEREGDVKAKPAALANVQPQLGEQVDFSKLPLSTLTERYVRSVRWVQREVPDYPDLAVVLYDLAEIYFYNNYLRRARAISEEIIANYPETDFASFAAGLIVDSHRYTGDLRKMRAATERFAAMTLGEDPDLAASRNETFAALARGSLFKEGELAYNGDNYSCALHAFMDYYDQYGAEGTDEDMKNIDLVVYNLAQSFSKLGKTDASNRYFELLLERFPRSVQAPATFWKMASNYERVLELEKAVGYYEDILSYHREHEDAANALYNAAFLKVGLKRFDEAASAYESYHDDYTDKEDAKDILFRAAETFETAEDIKSARRVYKKWLKLYGEEDADRWVETQRKLADYALAAGKRREAEKIVQLIYDSYENIKADLGGIGLRISADIAFQPLLAEFTEYEKLQFPNTKDQEELQEVLAQKLEWNKKIAADLDGFVVEFADFEWQSAALYYKALSFKRHGESWLQAPVPYDPDDPDEEEYFYIYMDQLSARAEPFEQTAVTLFETVVDFAKQKKRHNKWVDEALKELSRTDPNTYPVPKPERSSVIPSDVFTLPPLIEEVPELSMRSDDQLQPRLARTELP
ncbi:MAG TPA: hypothetical protein DIU15_13860 [Deltaproteobacteria bacterium]|nr:hypothetical protein [Deltaproteobacteria bacterium]HCP47125.1 hypothetical protein [Deltaproteobacteria bacterium]